MGFRMLNIFRRNHNAAAVRKAQARLDTLRKEGSGEDLSDFVRKSLSDSNWEIRNIGVKAAGLVQYQPAVARLIEILSDFGERGFVRRNAAAALGSYENLQKITQPALIQALSDPYYEVRVHAGFSLSKIGSPDEGIETILIGKIFREPVQTIRTYPIWFPSRIYREKNFEVRTALTCALGVFAATQTAMHALELLLNDNFWTVRESAIRSYVQAAVNMKLDISHIRTKLKDVDLTSPEFRPVFPIRKTWNDVFLQLKETGPVEIRERK